MTGPTSDPASQGTAPEGLVVVDKPGGLTSHAVVARLRKACGTRRVGHAGTLDPMATGVLVVGVGRATRLLGHLALTDKTYDATIRLGVTTVTDDAEGDVLVTTPAGHVTPDEIEAGLRALTGEIDQVPSAVSAIKVDGVRAHRLVRAGDDVVLEPRRVTVHSIDLHGIRRDAATVDVDITVDCTTGTYVRALARDLGAGLGVGGHLTALRRTRVGPYGLADARPLAELEQRVEPVPLDRAAAAAFPRLDVTAEQVGPVLHGVRLPADDLPAGAVAVFAPDGRLLALAHDDAGLLRYDAVFP